MTEQDPAYQAGYLDGAASRQDEIDRLEDLADRYYRFAFDDDRRPVIDAAVTAIELEQRRELHDIPSSVTTAEAMRSWGLPVSDHDQAEATTGPSNEAPTRTNRTSRRRAMSTRTIVGNLAADPEAVQAGKIRITKMRVVENTGEYRNGKWVEHPAPTTHFVEAKFELRENALASLRRGDNVVVIGYERTTSWERDGGTQYGRVIEADAIAANLARATVQITRTPRPG